MSVNEIALPGGNEVVRLAVRKNGFRSLLLEYDPKAAGAFTRKKWWWGVTG
jgi:hypothetical protein